jgi:hypothetical protein
MTKRAIVCVGVSQSRVLDRYVQRMRETFARYGGDVGTYVWEFDWPPDSLSHRECNYGFKVHAVDYARRKGHTSILWVDASCYAIKSIEPLWERLERDGHVLIEDLNPLGAWSSDASIAMFGVSRDEAMKIPLMCGTCWGLDLTVERSRVFLDRLLELATPENFNGTHVSRFKALAAEHPRPGTGGAAVSTDGRVWGHRSDETFMSLLANELKMETHVGVEFVGGMSVTEAACVRSGYDL